MNDLSRNLRRQDLTPEWKATTLCIPAANRIDELEHIVKKQAAEIQQLKHTVAKNKRNSEFEISLLQKLIRRN